MTKFFSFFTPKLPVYLAYMFQQVDYVPGEFVRWLLRSKDIRQVMYRKQLIYTPKAVGLLLVGYCIVFFYLSGALYVATMSFLSALITVLITPFLTALWLYVIVLLAWLWYEEPKRSREVRRAKKIFAQHPGLKIAIAGSYGKTTMKELLAHLLVDKNIAYTPANKNVLISQARWAEKLNGDEEVLIMEFGEGKPGDIERMTDLIQPDTAIITGLAPNHLDRYKTLDNVARDLLCLVDALPASEVFYNADDTELQKRMVKGIPYNDQGVLGWQVKSISVAVTGTSFSLSHANKKIKIETKLLGRHNIGPLACGCAIALELGVDKHKIIEATSTIEPYEHRMQARPLNDAWLIDDTYNGNLEGMLAGLELIKELKAKRKIYVTPGLVEQGNETERVHTELGRAIASARPHRVVLMDNSTTKTISDAMKLHGYKGDLQIVKNPLSYYEGLEHTLAKGDLVLLQNDWTDNYF